MHLVAASSGNAGLALAWVGKSLGQINGSIAFRAPCLNLWDYRHTHFDLHSYFSVFGARCAFDCGCGGCYRRQGLRRRIS